jgi:hypothetical protein
MTIEAAGLIVVIVFPEEALRFASSGARPGPRRNAPFVGVFSALPAAHGKIFRHASPGGEQILLRRRIKIESIRTARISAWVAMFRIALL